VTTSTSSISADMSKASDGYLSSVSGAQWSTLMSTPQGNANRFAVLASTDDDDDRGDQQFTLVRSQRAVRSSAKRQRERSSAQAGRQSNQPPASQRSRLITGQSSAVASGLWAAKTIVKKAVVCVDNVSLACNEDDIRAYVSKQGIEVFTCFKTNPRRRTNETAEDVSDRKAFRLCINAADRDRIFNPDAWPASIRISDWFFRDKNNRGDNNEKRRRINDSAQRGVTASSRGSAGDKPHQGGAVVNQDDLNETIAAASSAAGASAVAMDTVSNEQATDSDIGDGGDGQDDSADDNANQTTIYQYGECQ